MADFFFNGFIILVIFLGLVGRTAAKNPGTSFKLFRIFFWK